MSAQALTTAKPPWAVTVWADDNAIFLEIPCKDAPPYIQRYALSEAGLSKALYLMRAHYLKHKPATNGFGRSHKLINAKLAKPSEFTQEARDRALSILKDKGLLK